jgi:UDP-N-acetylglucosamine 4-epimerase
MNNTSAMINGDGEQTRDFTFVENAVQVNIKGMLSDNPEAKNKVYNVAVGEQFSVNYLYDFIRDYLKSDIKAIHREPREGDIRNSLADISLAKNLLGYQPTTKFQTGLIKTIEYFKDLYSQK